ncbi:MAG TPA: dihydroorotate dehydrogenase electron transfer subunit [Planctomycetota bacterium]|jgi:dihydroorotate dehydrogenase electron transfer subunit|nr:dihydroorotate dehydrogenase electron transfer subunit [Planctomycetota bacterium]
MPAIAPRRESRRVVSVEPIAPDCFRIGVEYPFPPDAVAPAQFFMLRRSDGEGPLLPRPFSLERLRDGVLAFLVKVFGRGSRALAAVTPGASLDLTGPLGRGFPPVREEEGVVMVAGGIGIAPFAHLVDHALAGGVKPESMRLVFGSSNAASLYALPLYESLGIRLVLSTDDGSRGFRGNAVACYAAELDARRIDARTPVLACGPERMLHAFARLARPRALRAFVSVETFMACGVGICNGCSVPVDPARFGGWPYAKACREGPVFQVADLREA